MKKTTLIITLAAVLGLVAVSCHDEPVNPSPSVRNVGYIACGDQHQVSVNGDESWHALLDSLFAAAESGCRVTFWNPDAMGSKQADTVTINTADRQQAYRWGEEMYDQGYIVSIVYDENTGTYHGTAVMSPSAMIPWPPITRIHTFWPFEEYLPGTWTKDTNVKAIVELPWIWPHGSSGYDFNWFPNWYALVRWSHAYGWPSDLPRECYPPFTLYSYPEFNQALACIKFLEYVSPRGARLVIDADTIYVHPNRLPTIYSYPYFITPGDSLTLYQFPNTIPANTHPSGFIYPVIEWSWDTLLIGFDEYDEYQVYIRNGSKKQ